MRSSIATVAFAGLSFAVAAAAQPAQPPHGHMPPGGEMMGQGQMSAPAHMMHGEMMTGQSMMMNDPEARRHIAEMARGCSQMIEQMSDMQGMQRRGR